MKTPNKGITTAVAIERFFGDIRRWPVSPDGHNFTQGDILRICQRIESTGECLWHAQSQALGWDHCSCAECAPNIASIGKRRRQQ